MKTEGKRRFEEQIKGKLRVSGQGPERMCVFAGLGGVSVTAKPEAAGYEIGRKALACGFETIAARQDGTSHRVVIAEKTKSAFTLYPENR